MAIRSEVLEYLGAEDARAVLNVLAQRHSELREEIEEIAAEVVSCAGFEEIAEQVVAVFAELSVSDLGTYSSADPFRERSDVEVAFDVAEETLKPFVERIESRARMGFADAALVHCEGVLLGLYVAECERVSEFLTWFPDGLADLADEPLSALAPVRRRRLSAGSSTVQKALKEFAAQQLPDWAWLRREL